MKEEALGRTLWKTRFGRGYGLRNELMSEWAQLVLCEGQLWFPSAVWVSLTFATENIFHNANVQCNTSKFITMCGVIQLRELFKSRIYFSAK